MLKVIALAGLQGSGKSTVAEALASKLHLPIFSVDPIEASIIKGGIKRSFETGLAAYLVADTLADEQLKFGQSVIIDAANYHPVAHNMWEKLALKHNAILIKIECICSDNELHKQRINKRTRNLHGIDEITWKNVQKRQKESKSWGGEKLVLDTAKELDENVALAIKYIQAA